MRQKGKTIAMVIALVIAIISLGVAFATFSTTLNINGTATVQSSSWDIYFTGDGTNYTKPTTSTALPSGNITKSASSITASGSVIATTFTWSATLKTPGDYVIYTIHVKNAGSYNAKFTSITKPAITCSSDPKSVCGHLHYGIYTNAGCTSELAQNELLNSGATDTFYVKVWLDDSGWAADGSGLPSANVTTNTISATVTYTQN